MLKSLANQTNKNFEIVFLMHPRTFVGKNYEFIFKTLTEASPVPVHFPKRGEYQAWIRDAYDKYDFVIQSKMDFDDFAHKDAVADTQNQIDNCENILLYGYCKGYSYVYADGELFPFFEVFSGIGHLGILQSFIWKSSFAKNLPTLGVYIPQHHTAKRSLEEFCKKNGVEFSENMFKQNTDMKAFIYFRHEFSHYILSHNNRMNRSVTSQSENKIAADEITRKQLEDDYGFTYELKSIE